MPELASSTIVILLAACVGLLFLLLLAVFRMGGSLQRIEKQLRSAAVEEPPAPAPLGKAEMSPGGAFEAFLAEDPARRRLTKNEQFKAYRRWRQENGMNWSNS